MDTVVALKFVIKYRFVKPRDNLNRRRPTLTSNYNNS